MDKIESKEVMLSKMKNIWNYDKKWVQWLDVILIFAIPYLIIFGYKAIPVISVNRHPVKVKAVIIDKCHALSASPGSRYYYYEYKYNATSKFGIVQIHPDRSIPFSDSFSGEYETSIYNLYGEIGDTIVIRCNKNNPSQSIINCNDFPYRTLETKEFRKYLRNEPSCFD